MERDCETDRIYQRLRDDGFDFADRVRLWFYELSDTSKWIGNLNSCICSVLYQRDQMPEIRLIPAYAPFTALVDMLANLPPSLRD